LAAAKKRVPVEFSNTLEHHRCSERKKRSEMADYSWINYGCVHSRSTFRLSGQTRKKEGQGIQKTEVRGEGEIYRGGFDPTERPARTRPFVNP